MKPAKWCRVLQLCGSADTHMFFACDEHEPLLESGEVQSAKANNCANGAFVVIGSEPVVEMLNPDNFSDDELYDCNFCYEG